MENFKDNMLGTMLKQLPTQNLPSDFNASLMLRIEKEAHKRTLVMDTLSIAATCLIALLLICGSIYTMSLYSDFNMLDSLKQYFTRPEGSQSTDLSLLTFYIFIGVCALLLLFADYQMRKIYLSRQNNDNKLLP